MGTLRRRDGDVVFAQDGVGEVRRVESGDVTVEFGRADAAIDPTPLFRGLPGDMCQCRHQGYVVRGRLTFKTKDGPVDVAAGEAFDVSPGHTPLFQPGCEWVQFTATAEQRKTDEAIRRNTAGSPTSVREYLEFRQSQLGPEVRRLTQFDELRPAVATTMHRFLVAVVFVVPKRGGGPAAAADVVEARPTPKTGGTCWPFVRPGLGRDRRGR